MAFGGNMGPAKAMTLVGAMNVPDGSTLSYDADAISLRAAAPGTVTAQLRPSLANLRFSIDNSQGPALKAIVLGAADPANPDTGSLSSADPKLNQHGIPVNFGPGRGNWTQADIQRLRAQVIRSRYDGGAITATGTAQVTQVTLNGSDIEILVRNMSERDADFIDVELDYRHSQIIA